VWTPTGLIYANIILKTRVWKIYNYIRLVEEIANYGEAPDEAEVHCCMSIATYERLYGRKRGAH